MNRRTIGWTGLAVLGALGVAAVINGGGDTPRAVAPVRLTQSVNAGTIQILDTLPTVEVRATRL